jgi:hypothetical protein
MPFLVVIDNRSPRMPLMPEARPRAGGPKFPAGREFFANQQGILEGIMAE